MQNKSSKNTSAQAFTLIEPKRSEVPAKAGIQRERGFTLIELSIVLVIVGLLVGGILGGQSLIRNAEIKSVVSDLNRYTTAITQFKDQYSGLPGDLADANSYWGTAVSGNGDGTLNLAAAASATGEVYEFWKQLALANFISGNYSGVAGPATNRDSVISGAAQNVPASRVRRMGYSMYPIGLITGNADTFWWDGSYGNVIIGGQLNNTGVETTIAALTPEEMWNLDVKMDDGSPSNGSLRSYRQSFVANCNTSDTQASSAYNLGYALAACTIILITGF